MEKKSDPPQLFCINIVPYGTSSAPSLTIRFMQKIFAVAAKDIRNNFYIKMLLTGAKRFEAILTIRDKADFS